MPAINKATFSLQLKIKYKFFVFLTMNLCSFHFGRLGRKVEAKLKKVQI